MQRFFTAVPSFVIMAASLSCALPPAHAGDLEDVVRLHRAGESASALQRADAAIAARPNDAAVRFAKGVVLSDLGRSDEAATVFERLTEDFPDLPEPYNNLAVLKAAHGRYDAARLALEAALRNNPRYATAYENLGDIYAVLAAQAYAHALEFEPGNATVGPKLALVRGLGNPAAPTAATGR